eukprot:TRINITY_DN65699_c0_g1_i1.p1 TRINITY_DN65699_c0_g1~~TRINITY_DN65699_c0_g1_i1.p1  ORF type:complete len:116 (+),score=23.58 TRINITY_DN65699_c0_g1_i1:116-463(+)
MCIRDSIGAWSESGLISEGRVLTGAREKFPVTMAWLEGMPVELVNARWSVIRPGTRILPHCGAMITNSKLRILSLIHISEPTRLLSISYAVFCLKKKKIIKYHIHPTYPITTPKK